jgi:hypothetical protein
MELGVFGPNILRAIRGRVVFRGCRHLQVPRSRAFGVIAESVPNRTVSAIEECGAQLPQGRNLLFERFRRPDVAAAEADVFPAERSDVGRVTCRAAFPWARRSARAASIGIVPRSRSVTGSGAACCPQMATRHTGRARRLRSTATSKRGIMPEPLAYDLERILR